MSKIYTIEYKETYENTYTVSAKNKKEAIEKLREAMMNGEVSGPNDCCDSSSKVIYICDDDGSAEIE